MAHAVQLVDPAKNRVAIGFKGFSWTCLFFGPFPALFRGHIVGFIVMLVAAIPTVGVSGLFFMFLYNGWHYNWLIGKGYRPAGAAAFGQPQNIINVSVGNVGTADHSQTTRIDAAPIYNQHFDQRLADPAQQPLLAKRKE